MGQWKRKEVWILLDKGFVRAVMVPTQDGYEWFAAGRDGLAATSRAAREACMDAIAAKEAALKDL